MKWRTGSGTFYAVRPLGKLLMLPLKQDSRRKLRFIISFWLEWRHNQEKDKEKNVVIWDIYLVQNNKRNKAVICSF